MNVSVIDIGSNTVKASVFKINGKGRRSIVAYKGFKVKLASSFVNVDGKDFISEEGIERLLDALSGLIDFTVEYQCRSVFSFATAALRRAENSDLVLSLIRDRIGIDVDILSGEEEAICSLRGLLCDECTHDISEGVMIDMGGGSTEIVYFVNGREPTVVSLPFGCLSLYQSFVHGEVPTDEEIGMIDGYVNKELSSCEFVKNINVPVFLIGGSCRAVRKLIYDNSVSGILRADGSDFSTVISRFKDEKYLQKVEEIAPGRSNTVCPACVAYRAIIKYIAPYSITVSESGVREGYLEKILP